MPGLNPMRLSNVSGERLFDTDWLDLLAPFDTETGRAPDLFAPRPSLRLVPGKLSGSPHIVNTRIETIALAALEERGLDGHKIAVLYPQTTRSAIDEALDLEHQIRRELLAA